VPVAVQGLTDATALALGRRHSCALRKTGHVACWGANGDGQLGDGKGGPSQPFVARPVQVRGLIDAIAIAVGDDHACALRRAGVIACWGANRWRQLGDESRAVFVTPTSLQIANVTAIAAGEAHTCVLRKQGAALCWGRNDASQLGGAASSGGSRPRAVAGTEGAVEIVAGKNHTCTRASKGAVKCWGANAAGQATGKPSASVGVPTAVSLPGAAELGAGDAHTCARMGDGTVRCWGLGTDGRLGQGDEPAREGPVLVPDVAGTAQLTVDGGHTCVRKSTGLVWCWGRNDGGALGTGRLGPSSLPGNPVVAGLDDAVEVESGLDFACARREQGGVVCWGRNDAGQLGRGATVASSAEPMTPVGVSSVIDIGIGDRHACAVTKRGEVSCWGAGERGQLGGGKHGRHKPMKVGSVKDAVEVVAGPEHTCVRLRDGGATCWGGTAGVHFGAKIDRAPPTPVKPLARAKSLAAGGTHACALEGVGSVKCWGNNAEGQLGNGSGAKGLVPQAMPVAVLGLSDAAEVVGGTKHTCARRATGQVVCWGDSSKGQLGAGVSGIWTTRVPVRGLTDAVALEARGDLTCAAIAGAGIECWGTALATGFFANGTNAPLATPIASPSGVRSFALGRAHACGLRGDGKVECWGDNTYGQRGDGALAYLDVATAVVGL
jgi:alpha-tubulin suppressor-like RCC1 family protein